jgi:aspartyl-tRNA(Asn)/glutamyl-tRNA(Gln) amidotransferase subunit B
MNSFKNVEKAIAFEIKRQKELISRGERITQETRNWDAETGTTTSMRSKEMAHDYRYFPEPDLLPLIIDQQWVDQIREKMPELPEKRIERYINECGLSEYDAKVITLTKEISDFFDEVVLQDVPAKDAANWLMGDVTAYLKNNNVSILETGLKAEYLKELIDLIANKTISGKIAKELILDVLKDGTKPSELVKQKGLEQISDSSELESVIEKILADNPQQTEEYRGGKVALKGFFVGQTMKATNGKANPAIVNQLLDKLIT